MPASLQQILLECLRQLLRPVVKFCLRRSLKLQEFLEASKQVFLEVAEEEMRSQEVPVSMSRLSVMTGVHRRDVMRLFKDTGAEKDYSNLLTRIIGQWQEDRRFISKGGKPRPLMIEGKESEFVELVRSVSQDLNPYTVLYELERVGAVERQEDRIQLRSVVYVPKGNVKESFQLVSADLDDLMCAAEENVFSERKLPNLHVKTQYDNVALASVPEIQRWFLEQGQEFHEKARKYLSQFDKDINPKISEDQAGARVAIGTFSRVVVPADDVGAPKKIVAAKRGEK